MAPKNENWAVLRQKKKNLHNRQKNWMATTNPPANKFPSSPLEGNTLMQMIKNFVDHTGVALVSYVGTRKSIVWKTVWLIVIAAGFTMTIIQSNDAIHDYFGYAITLRTTFEVNGTMQFPAITICANSPINWEMEKTLNSTIYREVTAKLNDESKRISYDEIIRKSRTYEQYVLLEVLNDHYDTIMKKSLNNYTVLNKLYWNGETYANKLSAQSKSLKKLEDEGIIYQLHDFLYGDCVIFNAEVNLANAVKAAALTGVEFTLQWDIHNRYPFNNDPATVLVVHPVGTPPILDDSNNIKINPGDEVNIAIQQREITRLPSPFPSHCVERTNHKLQSSSLYYEEDRPYLYSMEACIKTCMQSISTQSCFCWDAQIPLGKFKSTQGANYPVCQFDRCSHIDKQLTSKFCKCMLPCRETLLDTVITVKSGLLKEIAKKAAAENETENVDTSSIQQQQNIAKVKVFIKSAVYESITEEAKYTVADFWGIIGGNAGLWIGISAVSFFEIVELVCVMIKSKIRLLIWRKKAVQVLKTEETMEVMQKLEDKLALNSHKKSYKFLPDF